MQEKQTQQVEQILIENYSTSPEDKFFNHAIEVVQETLLHTEFQQIQTNFMKAHCEVFEATEQNKIQYMEIYQKYQTEIQKFIQNKLQESIPGFTIEEFMRLSEQRGEVLEDELVDLMQSFMDFQHFKSLCLVYKDFYRQEKLQSLCIKGTGSNT